MLRIPFFALLLFFIPTPLLSDEPGKDVRPPNKSLFFKTKTHAKLNMKVLMRVLELKTRNRNNKGLLLCRKHLKRTQWRQDILLFFHSKAHFDNCSFERSFRYINKLLKKNDLAYKKAFKLNNLLKRKKYLKKIMRNSGKILHAIQDFYSHSNYVESMQKQHLSFKLVPKIQFWNLAHQERILTLSKESLISGKVWWGFPKKCKKGSPSHGKLAKDTAKSRSGKRPTIWRDISTNDELSSYRAAISLAERASYEFLLHTFSEYPMLKQYCNTVGG